MRKKNSKKGSNQLEMIQTYVETRFLTFWWLQSRETTLRVYVGQIDPPSPGNVIPDLSRNRVNGTVHISRKGGHLSFFIFPHFWHVFKACDASRGILPKKVKND